MTKQVFSLICLAVLSLASGACGKRKATGFGSFANARQVALAMILRRGGVSEDKRGGVSTDNEEQFAEYFTIDSCACRVELEINRDTLWGSGTGIFSISIHYSDCGNRRALDEATALLKAIVPEEFHDIQTMLDPPGDSDFHTYNQRLTSIDVNVRWIPVLWFYDDDPSVREDLHPTRLEKSPVDDVFIYLTAAGQSAVVSESLEHPTRRTTDHPIQSNGDWCPNSHTVRQSGRRTR